MEIITTLNKPYTDQERCDFIVEYNHNQGYEIEETDESLLAIRPDPYIPTYEEQRQARENAYKAKVDPITCHINRLKDEEQTEEVIAEIAALVEERKVKVEEIKQRYRYIGE